MSLRAVVEILPLPQWHRPPGLPPILAGIIRRKGQALPVLPLRRLFGLAERPPELYTPLIHLASTPPLALLVDSVLDVVAGPSATALPADEQASPFTGLGGVSLFLPTGSVHLLDLTRLLVEAEKRALREAQAMVTRRLADWDVNVDGEG